MYILSVKENCRYKKEHQLFANKLKSKETAGSRFKMKGVLVGGLFLLLCISACVSLVSNCRAKFNPTSFSWLEDYLHIHTKSDKCIIFLLQPLSKNKMLFIEPKTIKYYASYYKSNMVITDSDRIIHIPNSGAQYEELIRVPLAGPDELDPHSVIRITVTFRPQPRQRYSDPHIGLTDGVNENRFLLVANPAYCYIYSASPYQVSIPSGTAQHYEYILLFEPYSKYGACSHHGGHITPGYFSQRLDISKGLDFIVKGDGAAEAYEYYYFLIEIL